MGTRTYRKWRAGSSAAGDPAQGEYNSENAQVYENGTLGPRPGWLEFTDTTGTKVFDPTTDEFVGFTWFLTTNDLPYLMVSFNDGAYKYDVLDVTNGDWEAGGSVPSQSVSEFWAGNLAKANFDDYGNYPCWNDGSQLTAIGGYLSVADGTTIGTPSIPIIAGAQPSAVTVYRERAYYWGIGEFPGRIYYSDRADYATVQASSYFDVSIDPDSYAGGIVGVWSVKNALLIATKDNRWLVLTGADSENGTLRELGRDSRPEPVTAAIVDNQLFFLNPTAQGVVVATPSFVEHEALNFMSPTAYPGSTRVRPEVTFQPLSGVGDEVTGDLFLPGRAISDAPEILAVERVNGVFNLSRWDYDTATPEALAFDRGRPGELWAMVQEASDWVPYSRNFTLNRPANSGDTYSKALGSEDGVTAGSEVIVDLGEHVASDGTKIRPTKVVIDLDYWKGGNYSAPELAIDATILGTDSAATPEDALAQQTVTTTGWVNTSGDLPYKRRVAVALPQGQYGTRFRIRLTYDNLALDAVQVYYDEQTDPR